MNSGTLETLGLKMVFRGVPPSPRLMRTTGQAYAYAYPCIVLGVLRWPGSAAVTAEVEQRLEEAEPNYLLSPRPWQRFLMFAEPRGWSRTAKYLFVIGVECWTSCACSWGLNINSRCCYWIEGLSQLLRPFSTWIFWLMTILVTRLIMK